LLVRNSVGNRNGKFSRVGLGLETEPDSGECSILNDFSVAQAFTPGELQPVVFKSPINGALIAPAVSHPGVNAWARENRTMKLD
jgi:hypothetical protein